MAKILEKRSLTAVTKAFRVEAPLVASAVKPGQFVIVRVREGGERIPLTIADYDRDEGTLTIVVQEVGSVHSKSATIFSISSARSVWHWKFRQPVILSELVAALALPRCFA